MLTYLVNFGKGTVRCLLRALTASFLNRWFFRIRSARSQNDAQARKKGRPKAASLAGFAKLGRAPVYGWLCKPEEGKAADACQGFFSAK
jgi:hypothetical protein